MMTEISLNILDIVQNSICAGADRILISVKADTKKDRLYIIISDNGSGMDTDQLQKVEDPFFTTRTSRKVGLGVPFFKYSAESTGGKFEINSELGTGTILNAEFVISHIDRMPLGDITSTMHLLITSNCAIDFIYTYEIDGREFCLDTTKLREILEDVPFSEPEVSDFIREYLAENKKEADNGRYI